MIRKLAIVLTVALAFSACSCEDPKPVPLETRVSISTPADGAILTLRDDVANDVAGLQIDVRGSATGFADTATATLRIDGTDTGLQVPVAGSAFAFPAVPVEAGARVLAVAVSDGTASGEAAAAVVVDDDPLPDSLEIVSPAHGTTLNAAADASGTEAGLQTEITVKSVMLAGGTVRLCLVAEGFTGTGACKQAQGQILAESTLAASGTTTLEVSLPEGRDLPIAAEWEKEGSELVVALPIAVSVDTLAPAIAFVVPVEGEVRTEQSFDVLLQTEAEEGQVATVTSSAVEGEQFVGAVDAEGAVTVHVTLPIGAQTLTAIVADRAGNSADSVSVALTVDVAGCDVQLSDPAGSSFVFNTVNSTVNGTAGTYTLRGHTTACPGGTVRFTKVVGGTATELGTATADASGDFSLAATFQDGEKDATLTVKVEGNLAPNDGLDLTYTADFTLPVVVFVAPVDGQVIASQATTIELAVTGAEEGQAVTFKSGGTEIGTGTVSATGTASANVNLALGAQTLSAEVADAAGNPGSGSVNVVVDIAGCDVALASPSNADFVFNLANTTAAAEGRTFAVTGTTTRCAGGIARFTKTVGGTSTELGTAQVDASGAFSYAASFADGEANATLNVKVEKGLAPNAGVGFAYRADFSAPSIAFVAPTEGATITSLTTTVEVQVTGAEQDQLVTFKAGGTTVGTGAVSATGLASSSVNLPLGGQTLSAEVADTAGNPASASIQVVVDTDGCDVELTNPSASDHVFNLANATVDQSATPRTGSFTVTGKTTRCAGGTARFTKAAIEIGTTTVLADGTFSLAVPLVDGESSIGVNVKVEKNLAPNAGVSFTYRADFTAPTLAFIAPTDGQTVTSLTPTLEVAATGAEQDQVVTFKTGGTTIGTGTVSATGAASATVNLTVGAQTLSAEVTDAAGNPASASIAVLVDTAGCDVALTNPTAAAIIFNLANATVTAGTPKTGSFTLTGTTMLCAGGTARFTKTVGAVVTELGTTPVNASGAFTYAATFEDSEADATLNVKVEKNLAPNAGINLSYSADFTAPSLDVANPVEGDLYVVHQSNARLVAGEAGFVADADAATAGGQLDLALTVAGVGTIASTGSGRVVIALGSSELFNQTYAANGQQTVAQQFTLPEGYSGPMTVSLTDAAGNTASGAWNVNVATVALPTPTISLPSAGTINVFRDLGGDRATYAAVQGNVNFASAVPAGTQIRVCSTVQYSGAAACGQAGYYVLPNTTMTASGTGQFYGSLRLPQGVQTIRAELTDVVGSLASSVTVALTVDTVPPVVTSLASLEDANKDGLLTGTELPSGQPSHFTAQMTGVADGRQISLWDGAVKLATVNVAAGAASFTVTSLADGLHALKVLVTDAANNPNESTSVSPAITNPAASLALNVKRIAPSISVIAPTFAICNLARDKELSTEDCEVDFVVAVSAGATRVEFSGPVSPTPASVTSFTNSRATATYSLGQGGPFTLVAIVYDSAGNPRQASVSLSVDTIAPTLAFTSPTASDDPFTSQSIPVTLTTNAEAGRLVTVTSSINGMVVGTGAVAAGTASFTANVPYGSQSLSASVSDLAGNLANAAPVAIELDLAGCDINFINPKSSEVVFNKANTPTGSVTITGNSIRSDCVGQTINFYAAVNGAPESLVGTQTIDASGNFSIPYTFGDGTVTVFTGQIDFNAINRSSFTATTDLTPPTLMITSPVPNTDSELFVVAQAGNINVRDNVAGYLADADAAPDGQVNFNLSVVGGGSFDGLSNGRIVVMQGGTEVASQVISDNGTVTVNPLTATLQQAFVGPLTIMVTDSAGNSAGADWDLTVDVVPPAAPTFVTADPGDGNYTRIQDERHADVDVWLLSPADDGPNTGNIDWTFGYVTERQLAGEALSDAVFDDPARTTAIQLPALPANTPNLMPLRDIHPLNRYILVARSTDNVGNNSSIATTPEPIDLMWETTTISHSEYSPTQAYFGANTASGDIDGDGAIDLAIGAYADTNSTGLVSIVFGPLPSERKQTLRGTQANAYFGNPVSIVDVNKDGKGELLVGNNGILEAYAIEDAGLKVDESPLVRFSQLGKATALPDLNGDGFGDFAFGVGSADSYLGKVYIFFSREEWTSGLVDVTTADIIISGSVASGRLGALESIASIENAGGLGSHCILVGAYRATKVYAFMGSALLANGRATTTAHAIQTLSSTASAFGSAVVGFDVDGDGNKDAVVSAPGASSVYWFRRTAPNTFASTGTLLATGGTNLGRTIAIGDLDDDGNPDLALGTNSTTNPTATVLWSNNIALDTQKPSILSGNGGFGYTIQIANINDGPADLIIGEFLNGNGRVLLFH